MGLYLKLKAALWVGLSVGAWVRVCVCHFFSKNFGTLLLVNGRPVAIAGAFLLVDGRLVAIAGVYFWMLLLKMGPEVPSRARRALPALRRSEKEDGRRPFEFLV